MHRMEWAYSTQFGMANPRRGTWDILYQVVLAGGMHNKRKRTIEQRRLFRKLSDWSKRCAAKLNLFAGGSVMFGALFVGRVKIASQQTVYDVAKKLK